MLQFREKKIDMKFIVTVTVTVISIFYQVVIVIVIVSLRRIKENWYWGIMFFKYINIGLKVLYVNI